jgi:hypothetical protein
MSGSMKRRGGRAESGLQIAVVGEAMEILEKQEILRFTRREEGDFVGYVEGDFVEDVALVTMK